MEKTKVAVRYYSKTGNTTKLAQTIAQVANVKAETVDVPLAESVDILFLGSSVYAAGVDPEIKKFIEALDPSKVKTVINFSTAALIPSTYGQVKKLLAAKGIALDTREFHCRGSFSIMHKGKPNHQDLEKLEKFTKNILKN